MKFLKKKKVLKDCWIEDSLLGRVPLEISLLCKLDHPNIVAVSISVSASLYCRAEAECTVLVYCCIGRIFP